MKKKFFAIVFLLFLVPALSNAQEIKNAPVANASDNMAREAKLDKKNNDVLILSPKEIASVTSSSKVLVSGMAKVGDEVNIDISTLIISKGKDGSENIITPLDNYEIKVDNLGIFAQEVELKKGDNLIEVRVKSGEKTYSFKYVITYDDISTEDMAKKVLQISESGIV